MAQTVLLQFDTVVLNLSPPFILYLMTESKERLLYRKSLFNNDEDCWDGIGIKEFETMQTIKPNQKQPNKWCECNMVENHRVHIILVQLDI